MFEESLIESVPALNQRSRWPALASIAVQTVLVAGLLIIPILHPEVLPMVSHRLTVLPPPVLRPVPPPPQRVVMRTVDAAPSAPSAPAMQPVHLSVRTLQTDATPVETPALAFGTSGTPNPAAIAALMGSGPVGPSVSVAGPASSGSAGHSPLLISTGVMAGRLIAPIQPVYPPIARISHTEGSVVVQAVISKAGRIESARVVSGPAMLRDAALSAVRDARYWPFLLNNQPTEVETTITINFRLGNG